MRCCRVGCKGEKPAVVAPKLLFHPPGGRIRDPATAEVALPTCIDCMPGVTADEFVGKPEQRVALAALFLERGKPEPDWSLTELV